MSVVVDTCTFNMEEVEAGGSCVGSQLGHSVALLKQNPQTKTYPANDTV